jgi:hypothetical protein
MSLHRQTLPTMGVVFMQPHVFFMHVQSLLQVLRQF